MTDIGRKKDSEMIYSFRKRKKQTWRIYK